MKIVKIVIISIFLNFLLGIYVFGYNYDCSVGCPQVCGNDYLCLLQCYSCCPVNNVIDSQTCEMCGGYWDQRCYDDENHMQNGTTYNAAPARPLDAHTILNPALSPFEVIRVNESQKSQLKISLMLEVPHDKMGQNVTLFWMYCEKNLDWCSSLFPLGSTTLSEDYITFNILPVPQNFTGMNGDFYIYVGFAGQSDFMDVVYNYYELIL